MEDAPVLIIGDADKAYEIIASRLVSSPRWQPARPIIISGRGPTLFKMACQAVEQYFTSSGNAKGAILLDLNWGPDASTLGCEFVWWIRAAGYRQPMLIRSHYVRDDGRVNDMIAPKLPEALGWEPWRGSDTIDAGWPDALGDSEFERARDAAHRLSEQWRIRALDRLWSAVKQASAGEPDGWEKTRDLLDLIKPQAEVPLEEDAFRAVVLGIEHRNVVQIRDSINWYEELIVGSEE